MSRTRFPMSPAYELDISAGRVPGTTVAGRFGRNRDVDTADVPETLWSTGGLWVPPPSASIHDIVSTSALDTFLTGTGAQVVVVSGLDADYNPISEPVSLNGLTPVPTTLEYLRLGGIVCVQGGATRKNQGNITATSQATSIIASTVFVGDGTALQAIYTVPAGKTGYLYTFQASIVKPSGSSNATAVYDVELLPNSPDAMWVVGFSHGLAITGTSTFAVAFQPPVKLVEKTDLVVNCVSTSANNIDTSAGFSIILEDN